MTPQNTAPRDGAQLPVPLSINSDGHNPAPPPDPAVLARLDAIARGEAPPLTVNSRNDAPMSLNLFAAALDANATDAGNFARLLSGIAVNW